MFKLIGWIGMLLGVVLGFATWLWIFVIGINQIIDGFGVDPTDVSSVVWGFANVLVLSEVAGYVVGCIFFFGGAAIAALSE